MAGEDEVDKPFRFFLSCSIFFFFLFILVLLLLIYIFMDIYVYFHSYSLVDTHAMGEVCHHLTLGEKWEDLTRILTDLTFVELKSQCDQAYGLLSDYNAATKDDLKYEGKDKVSAFRDFFKRYIYIFFFFFFLRLLICLLFCYSFFLNSLIFLSLIFLSNIHVLLTNPSLVFQQAANEPSFTLPSKIATQNWHRSIEKRSWLEWVNKSQEKDSCKMTFSGI